ncbi:hypothetical protein [Amycolatopsis magusensis]|uniref:hypothetical protein n=1 Tax=Amycolatopsis magusensis TaxID=882444 RepID=UPI003C2D16FD
MREQQRRSGADEDEDQPLSAEVPRTPKHPDLDPQQTKDVDIDNLPNSDDITTPDKPQTPPTGETPEPPD